MRHILFSVLFFVIVFSGCKTTNNAISKNGSKLSQGMVVCSHPAASKVGIDILKQGGNAFDAAIATQLALAVCYPRAGNLGGGGFMVYRDQNGQEGSLDFRERAPYTSSTDMFLDNRGQVIDNMSLVGVYASGVPGSVDGMWQMHREKGSLPWCQLVQPAVDLAQNGVILTFNEAEHMNEYAQIIDSVSKFSTAYGQKKWKAGDRFIQQDLATTLTAIRDYGRNGFYKGAVATNIKAAMITHYGLISQKDLDEYHAVWRAPIVTSYKGYQITMMPPPSSGGIMISQMLYGFEQLNLSQYPLNSVQYIHGLTELQRRAYADRSTYFGDPDYVDNHETELLSEEFVKNKIKNISMDHATPSQEILPGKASSVESFETTHFSVVDGKGNGVGITTTLNVNYGSKLVVNHAGFLLNNEMDDFSSKPGEANMFGLIGGTANSIQPGKRMLSSMTPTIISKDGKLIAVIGTPGGSTIITANFQTIVNVIDYKMSMLQSVLSPKMHSQWVPDVIYLEQGKFSNEVILGLQKMGHKIKETKALGKLDCIMVHPDGTLEGGTDKSKGDGTISGY